MLAGHEDGDAGAAQTFREGSVARDDGRPEPHGRLDDAGVPAATARHRPQRARERPGRGGPRGPARDQSVELGPDHGRHGELGAGEDLPYLAGKVEMLAERE